MVRLLRSSLIGALLAWTASAGPVHAIDADLWDALLERHTREVPDTAGVRVDYRGIAGDPDWPTLIRSLETGPAPSARDAQLAFWINAYNVLAIDVVLGGYPVESIRDLGSFLSPVWDRPAGRVAGARRTLGEIEHEILRPLSEPRIHAAIVCASTSCPSLRREAFRAERLETQLEAGMRSFLAEPRKGSRLADDTLLLSKIFDWFEEDFEAHGGLRAYLLPRLPEATAARWREDPDLRVRHLDYDWSLNDTARARP